MSSHPLFPNIRPLDDPPPLAYSIHHGRRTPWYALAWKCPARKYGTLMKAADLGLNVRTVGERVITRWVQETDFPRAQHPTVYLGSDGDFYLVAMFNGPNHPDYATRALNQDDPLIVAARHILLVTDELQPSFKWYRYPVRWARYNPDSDEDNVP